MAWAMAAAVVALTALASAFAPSAPRETRPMEQAALHASGCTSTDETGDIPERAMRD